MRVEELRKARKTSANNWPWEDPHQIAPGQIDLTSNPWFCGRWPDGTELRFTAQTLPAVASAHEVDVFGAVLIEPFEGDPGGFIPWYRARMC